MGIINVGAENTASTDLYYEDNGSGAPIVLLHGWPLDSRSWEPQLPALVQAGYRVVTYDRRGFGRSSRPSSGYDFDTLAGDLNTVIETLDLHDVTLVGFSLGTGELARYIGQHGTDRVRSCVMIESLAPTFAKSPENPQGADRAAVSGVQQAILGDRYAWLSGLLGDFLNLEQYLGKRVSEETVRAMWQAGADASPLATWACPEGWLDDFSRTSPGSTYPLSSCTAPPTASCRSRGRDAGCTPLSHRPATSRSTAAHTSCVSRMPLR